MGVCRLSIDYNRSFKYLAAHDIKDYIEKFNAEPSVLMIDAPRYKGQNIFMKYIRP